MEQVGSDFHRCGVHLPGPEGEYLRAVGKAILASEGKHISIAHPAVAARGRDLFPDILRYQVFAHHIRGDAVSFESKAAEVYAASSPHFR